MLKEMSVPAPVLWPRTFKQAVCQSLRIAPEKYAKTVFRRCLYRHAWVFALLIHRLNPDYFEEDFSIINDLAEIRDPAIFTSELNYFFGRNRRDKRWFRTSFAIRVSAKRIIRLKNRVV
jgi:hypothetical protein